MAKRAPVGPIGVKSCLIEKARVRSMNALARFLAKPLGEFSTLTKRDQQALSKVLRRGDVLLSSGNTRCAALVKRLTRSTWSHVSMFVGPLAEEPNPLCVVEAHISHGVRAIRLKEIDAQSICVLRPVGLDDADRERLVASVLRHVGSEYDLVQAWVLARNLLVRRWRTELRSLPTTMRRSATQFICSSLIAQAFGLIGHSIRPADRTAAGGVAHHSVLVPADFERASLFAVVWPVNEGEERRAALAA